MHCYPMVLQILQCPTSVYAKVCPNEWLEPHWYRRVYAMLKLLISLLAKLRSSETTTRYASSPELC
jgi:hypothetical protein